MGNSTKTGTDRTVTTYVDKAVLVARLIHLSETIRELESYQHTGSPTPQCWPGNSLHDLYAELRRIWPQVEEYYTQNPINLMGHEFYAELVQIMIRAVEYLRKSEQ